MAPGQRVLLWVDYQPASPNFLNSGDTIRKRMAEKHDAKAAWLSALLLSGSDSLTMITSLRHASIFETPLPKQSE
jgi:hypothetical protein